MLTVIMAFLLDGVLTIPLGRALAILCYLGCGCSICSLNCIPSCRFRVQNLRYRLLACRSPQLFHEFRCQCSFRLLLCSFLYQLGCIYNICIHHSPAKNDSYSAGCP